MTGTNDEQSNQNFNSDSTPNLLPENSLTDAFINNEQNLICNRQQVPRFLKTVDFELHEHDDALLSVLSVDECIDQCVNNVIVWK